ncbi:MAG: AraC family transcriptional regulator [Chitinivibrionales bacterium]|nr:AraC family transcriptional regulator [Chitinivibrionales bacterium]
MPDIHPVSLGADTPHELDYVYDRPFGLGDGMYLVMHLRTPVRTRTTTGIVEGYPGDCLIHDPSFPQYLTGHDNIAFRNDWVHFRGDDAPGLLRRFRLPLNVLFRPGPVDFFVPLILDMQQELHRRGAFWRGEASALVERLLRLLGRAALEAPPRHSRSESIHLRALSDVRMRVHQDLTRQWNVSMMAAMANVSPSRFSVLYRKFYGVSPLEDLLRERITFARQLLSNASVSISWVAEACGFSSLHYFSRLFHRRVGCAPRDYYRWQTGRR